MQNAVQLLFAFPKDECSQVRRGAKVVCISLAAYFALKDLTYEKEQQYLFDSHFHFVLKLKMANEVHNSLYPLHGLGEQLT